MPYPPAKRRRMDKRPANNAKRLSRNRARRKAIKAGLATRGDGRDVHHVDGNPLNNASGNLAIRTKKRNRSQNK